MRRGEQLTKFTGPSKKTKNRIMSFRIPEDVIADIEYISYKKGISTNAYVRDILIKHARWDVNAEKFGLIPVPRQLLSSLMKETDPEKIEYFMTVICDMFKDWVMGVKGEYGLKQSIESLEDFMRASGIASDHRVVGDLHTYIIKHDMGVGWSLFGQKLLTKIFGTFVPSKPVDFEITPSTLIAKISLGGKFSEHDY
ncbi:MAG TPA: hypothetical protein VNL34_03365 [Candidatus Nitrosotenuis sp.]|nr:hypothetical protein [Candidatus Nitrosotenuis sp.]